MEGIPIGEENCSGTATNSTRAANKNVSEQSKQHNTTHMDRQESCTRLPKGCLPEDKKLIQVGKSDSKHLTNNGHLFYIIVKDNEERTRLIKYLKKNGINSVFHYVPLHSSPAGRRFGRTDGDLSNTIDLSERVLRLPLYYEMTEDQLKRVVKALQEFYE